MKYVYSFAVFALLCCAVLPVRAEALEIGQLAPPFEVSYDDSKVLRSADLAGNVLVITCESRETKDINKPFKDVLLQVFQPDKRLRRNISLVPVIDCFAYPWPIKGFCVRGVRDATSTLNLQLYVDMTGKMFADYGAASDASTVIVIDRSATVRYIKSGRIPDEEISSVIELIRKLAKNPQQPE